MFAWSLGLNKKRKKEQQMHEIREKKMKGEAKS